MDRQFDVLYGYLALARRPAQTAEVDDRTRLLVRELAAERSGCRWCIDRARHDWRAAGLPVDLLRRLPRHATSPGLREMDRAALALVDAVACAGGSADGVAAAALARVRRHFSERGLAELTGCLADHHLIADDHQS
jgi:alkylhydroperoxidase family enzyme